MIKELSIIIPVYNSEEILEDLTEKLIRTLEEKYNDFEIILINDASMDNSWKIVQKLCEKNKLIKGAAIDVFSNEPLTNDNPLFSIDNVLLSPHISGNFLEYQEIMIKQFNEMLVKFNNSLPLALAAYNAGPGRVKIWVKRYGDPRKEQISYENWIESIPISETRFYVQKVLSNLRIYQKKYNLNLYKSL